ncbi:MAG: hypothetical protein ACTSRG_24515 [Candidatus Helarchaeota archaeon]
MDCPIHKLKNDPVLYRLIKEKLKGLIKKSKYTKKDVFNSIQNLKMNKMPITLDTVADELGCSRETLRKNKDYKKLIYFYNIIDKPDNKIKNNSILKEKSKSNKPKKSIEITKEIVENCIKDLLKNDKNITISRVCSKLGVSTAYFSNKPKLKLIIVKYKNKKLPQRVYIDPRLVKNAIKKLQTENQNITYKSIALLAGVDYWNLQKKPEITKIIKPYLIQKNKKKYNFNSEDILKTISLIRKEGAEVSINEVCRQLNCHKSFFRNNPNLKNLILEAKKKDKEKNESQMQFKKDFENLSPEAKKFEPIYIEFIKGMEEQGKNWKIPRNNVLSDKLGIPLEILIELKLKYCPSTRKGVIAQKKRK